MFEGAIVGHEPRHRRLRDQCAPAYYAERHLPRYFFNIFDGRSTPDTDGTELPDWQAVRREAIRLAGHVLRDEATRLIPDEEWRMEVTDHTGLTLFQIDLSFTEAPAVRSLRLASG